MIKNENNDNNPSVRRDILSLSSYKCTGRVENPRDNYKLFDERSCIKDGSLSTTICTKHCYRENWTRPLKYTYITQRYKYIVTITYYKCLRANVFVREKSLKTSRRAETYVHVPVHSCSSRKKNIRAFEFCLRHPEWKSAGR